LAEIALPSKPIGEESELSTLFQTLAEGRKALRDKERIKSGKVKLWTLEAGETGEWVV